MIESVYDPKMMLRDFQQGEMKKTLEDCIFEEQVKIFMISSFYQFHFGQFYSYLKMKEQEIRNIAWIGQNVTRNKKGGVPMDWEKCKTT